MNRAEMQMAIKAVCGMTVDPNAGKPSYAHGARTYHFCLRRLPPQIRRRP